MGWNDINNYGSREDGCIIMEKICEGGCDLPGCARNCGKMHGAQFFELRLNLAGFGPYTTGGWDMTQLLQELGVQCITGMACNMSWDPYGCKVPVPACSLRYCVPTDAAHHGNLESSQDDGFVDFSQAVLQVFKDGEEVEEGWVAPATTFETDVWVMVWAN